MDQSEVGISQSVWRRAIYWATGFRSPEGEGFSHLYPGSGIKVPTFRWFLRALSPVQGRRREELSTLLNLLVV
jgi:hypothetical protein